MPIKLCAESCSNKAVYRGRCAEHSRQRERQTHPNKAFYNTKRWKLTRRQVLFEQPLCPCGTIAEAVDHIVAIEDGGDKWARANLQGLCLPCHAAKTAKELRAR